MESAAEMDAAIQRLRAAGLVVHGNGTLTRGFLVHRPTSVPGNRREGYAANIVGVTDEYTLDAVEVLDAPIGAVLRADMGAGGWAFRVWDWCPGPGPGDFERRYPTLESTVTAVLDYYFGDPGWMCDEYNSRPRRKRCT